MTTCYLCIEHVLCKDGKMVFAGYHTYSAPPWQLTATGSALLTSIVYQTNGATYDDACKQMHETAAHLADRAMTKWPWADIWTWIDSSVDAHERRYDLIQECRRDAASHGGPA